jgi:glycosyltransferase 2 family protein
MNMTTPDMPPKQKSSRTRQILKILLQVVFMVVIFGALLWYVGIGSLYNALLTIKVEYLLLAFLMYFGINLLFTVRLRRVLSKNGVKTSFGKTLLAQYAGMLTSDVTPGRSGYILTPVYLRDQNVPASKGLSSVLGIQTFEFLIKVIGGIGAVIFLVSVAPPATWDAVFHNVSILGVNVGLLAAILGIVLMTVGAAVLAAFTWSQRAISIFDKIANSRILKRFTGGIMGKLEEYKESSGSTSKAIPEIVGLTFSCWIIKGFEWWFLGYALGISQLTWWWWLAFFLIHPLVTALAFVPITPAGIGVQEFGIIGILGLVVNVPTHPELVAPIAAFALLARGLLILEDLAGIPQIVKSTSLIFSHKKPDAPSGPSPLTPI